MGEYPEIGMAYLDIAAEAKILVEGSYLILYRIRADDAQIVQVLHGMWDTDPQLFEDSE